MAKSLRSADVTAGFHADIQRMRRQWLEPWRAHDRPDFLVVRPAPKKWSAVDCLDHVVRANAPYVKYMRDAVERARVAGQRPVDDFKPSMLGARMVKTLAPRDAQDSDGLPQIPMPMPTMGSFDPAKLGDPAAVHEVLDRWDDQLQKFRVIANDLETIDLHVRCKTLFPVLKLRLGDVARYLMAHAERHRIQAERAIATAARGG